jgi:hypothetical protein
MTVGAVFATMFRREATKLAIRRAGNVATGSNPVTASVASKNQMSSLSSSPSQDSQTIPEKAKDISSSWPWRDLEGWVRVRGQANHGSFSLVNTPH